AQLGLGRLPLDVEEARVGRAGAVLEHVQPPRITVAGDAHVIGHDVEDDSHAPAPERLRHAVERRRAADLRIESVVVRDVVAVRAARPALEAWGEVGVADAEGFEIVGEGGYLVEPEGGPELEPIGRAARPLELGYGGSEDGASVGHGRSLTGG